jgi:flagella basal body P-ring formation protein FlgA
MKIFSTGKNRDQYWNHTKFLFFFITCVGLLLASPLSPSDAIYLKPRAIVYGNQVYLSNIARLPDGVVDIPIFESPDEPITYTSEEISKKLPLELSSRKVLGTNCNLIPLNKKFLKKEIENSFLGEVSKRDNIDAENLKVTYVGEDIFFPAKGVEIKWGNIPKNMTPGNKIFTLDAWKDASRIYSIRTKFLVEMKISAYVVSKKILRNQVVTEKEIEKKDIFISETISDLISSPITGMTALSNLEEGDILRKKHLREVFTIQRGSNVEIIFLEGNLLVATKATARDSGNTGDKIRVQSKSSGTLLLGTIKAEGTVLID